MADSNTAFLEALREYISWQQSIDYTTNEVQPMTPSDKSIFKGRKLAPPPAAPRRPPTAGGAPPKPQTSGGSQKKPPRAKPLMNLRGAMKSLRR